MSLQMKDFSYWVVLYVEIIVSIYVMIELHCVCSATESVITRSYLYNNKLFRSHLKYFLLVKISY